MGIMCCVDKNSLESETARDVGTQTCVEDETFKDGSRMNRRAGIWRPGQSHTLQEEPKWPGLAWDPRRLPAKPRSHRL